MPCIISNCECIAGVRREWHLCFLRFSAGGKYLVKNRPDMRRRVVWRQIKLHCDAFPQAVGVFEDAVARIVASQDRHWIHWHLLKVPSEPALQARSEPLHERRLHFFRAKDATGDIPPRALPGRQMTNVFGKKT